MTCISLTAIIYIFSVVQTTAGKCFNFDHHMISTTFTDITVHPQSVNTTLNSTVNFTCEAVAEDIVFRVNDTSAANKNINNRGFTQQPAHTLNGGKLRRTLSAKALKDNNNTNISCKAYGSMKDSDIAILRIQGELML